MPPPAPPSVDNPPPVSVLSTLNPTVVAFVATMILLMGAAAFFIYLVWDHRFRVKSRAEMLSLARKDINKRALRLSNGREALASDLTTTLIDEYDLREFYEELERSYQEYVASSRRQQSRDPNRDWGDGYPRDGVSYG